MKRAAWRILVHLCSLLVLMPVGWCCWLPVLRAEEKPKEADCCCCAKQTTEKPKDEAPPAPPSCRCDPQPAAFLSMPDQSGKQSHDTLPMAVIPAESASAGASAAAVPLLPFLHDPSPPLHLLHCLWLC